MSNTTVYPNNTPFTPLPIPNGKAHDLTGKTFQKLTALGLSGRAKNGNLIWRCVCSCPAGNQKDVRGAALKNGSNKSCGCLARQAAADRVTHGYSRTKTYNSWTAMKQRCLNHNHDAYGRYGGAIPPVTIDPPWMKFGNFLADMGERPEGKTLHRMDNANVYSKKTCIWADQQTQARERKNSHIISLDGERLCAAEGARKLSISAGHLYKALRGGLSIEEYLRTREPQPMFTANEQPNYNSPETRREIASCLQVIYEIAPMLFSVDDVAKAIEKCQRQTYRLMKDESTPSVEVARRMYSFSAKIMAEHRFILHVAA